jgi:hypothetical protein
METRSPGLRAKASANNEARYGCLFYGFLIFVALVGAWLIDSQLLGTASPSLPGIVQRGLNCR